MGKTKHKKHHRHGEDGEDTTEDASNAGLKLILKVGSKNHEKHKKKKKKKDKKKERDKERKHRHHHKEKQRLSTDQVQAESQIKIEEDEHHDDLEMLEDQDNKQPQKALTRLLEQMLHHLQKKDLHGFFANPVNDQIAPGYSSIISRPMDFSTMRTKLTSQQGYTDLGSFKHDFELICQLSMKIFHCLLTSTVQCKKEQEESKWLLN